jgi:hypothetical protein
MVWGKAIMGTEAMGSGSTTGVYSFQRAKSVPLVEFIKSGVAALQSGHRFKNPEPGVGKGDAVGTIQFHPEDAS